MNSSEADKPKETPENLVVSSERMGDFAMYQAAIPKCLIAAVAPPETPERPLQNGLAPALVEALLTNVMHRFRRSWLDGPARLWGDIHPIHELAGSDLHKRIALLLSNAHFDFAQFLCGIEMLALKLEVGDALVAQRLLSCEKHGAELRGSLLDLEGIVDSYERSREFHSDLQGRSGCVDRG
ncbi:hypothetical protein [Xylella fastidiosa]|uniref:hypothetical protein n=2 Tax=Xylella fastidiosa TaxID=2371 RepID=UPI0012ACDCEC|nr:hypothetical protein [Xylella fastidiosa]QMT65803.1 hypothetical protein DVT08_004190 [Xylella fastidiosa subsp. multiplex]WLE28045.1 hypothetical protein DVS74_004085 [Xylella fastidiosa subsp. multiplex]